MFKKTADLLHFHERTGSHATKGSGRGTVWWNANDPEAYDPILARRALRKRRAVVCAQHYLAMTEFKQILEMQKRALEQGDNELRAVLLPSIRAFGKNLRKSKKEIGEIKAAMALLPKPPPKGKSWKRALTVQRLIDNGTLVLRRDGRLGKAPSKNIPDLSDKD